MLGTMRGDARNNVRYVQMALRRVDDGVTMQRWPAMVGTTRGDAAKGVRRVATSSRYCEATNAATVVTACWNHWRQSFNCLALVRTVLGSPVSGEQGCNWWLVVLCPG